MDKEFLKYLNRESNICIGELKITRDVAPNGSEYITVCMSDGRELYTFWHNPRKAERKNENPKHIGGRKPYLMLMIGEIKKLKEQGVKNVPELVGYLVSLGDNIEWNTGRLIHKRSKKSLQYKDLLEVCGCSKPKLNKLLAQMKELDLLYYTSEGYFVSSRLIKKGKQQS